MSFDRIIETGTYTGNGTTATVTIGWQSALIVIHSTAGNAANRALTFKSTDMSGSTSIICSTDSLGLTTGGVTITSTGFTVGNKSVVNTNGQVYHWFAVQDGAHINTGTYVGNQIAGNFTYQTIDLGRQPEIVAVFDINSTTKTVAWCAASNAAQPAFFTATFSHNFANAPPTILSNGFKVNNSGAPSLNISGTTYLYATICPLTDTRHVESGQIAAGGSLTVTIGYQPRVVWIFTLSGLGGFKTDTMSDDDTGELTTGYAFDAAGGITITSTGFSLGGDFTNVAAIDWVAWVN
jgi:hypothetical protein